MRKRAHSVKVEKMLDVERRRQKGLKRSKHRYFSAYDQTSTIECILLGSKYSLFDDADGPINTAKMWPYSSISAFGVLSPPRRRLC